MRKKLVINKVTISIVMLLVVGIFGFLKTKIAYANHTNDVQVIDATTLIYDHRTWVDSNPYDDTYEWVNNQKCSKFSKLHVIDYRSSNMTFNAELYTGDGCDTKNVINGVGVIDGGNIDIKGYKTEEGNLFFPTGFDSGCYDQRQDAITHGIPALMKLAPTNDDDYETNKYFKTSGSGAFDKDAYSILNGSTAKIASKCMGDLYTNLRIADKSKLAKAIDLGVYKVDGDNVENPSTGGSNNDDDAESQGKNADCMANSKGFGLAWVMCPIYNAAESAMNRMLNYLHDILYTNLGEGNEELKAAWGSLKNVANVLFVFALLIVLGGQAIKGNW